jgi:hypothetical protein
VTDRLDTVVKTLDGVVKTPEEIRAWIRKHVKACPCCGGAIVVQIDGGPEILEIMERLKNMRAKVSIVTAEDAEENLRGGTGDV